ncbi:hypothetical protein LguiA_007626 [Lonicera macranthoides]
MTRTIQNRIEKNHTTTNHTGLIFRSAIASRLLVIALIILWRNLLSPYDTSASLNPNNCISSSSSNNGSSSHGNNIRFPGIATAIEESIVWDGVYFVRIAECGGYEYEQSYAFLPLLPISISFLSRTVFAPLIPLIGHRAVLGLSSYVLNNVAFLFAAVYLYKLSVIVLKDPEAALRASILYSESLYALLSIGGLYHLISGKTNYATLCLALSGSARSNGVLNAGYICFQTMHRAYDVVFVNKRYYVLIAGALRSICVFVPFIAFQAYGYYNICLGRSVEETRPWCKARIPLLYNFIQSHYWGVGFLRYFQLKQLPNFLLAFPILSLAVCSIIYYAKLRREVFLSLGFRASPVDKKSAAVLFSVGTESRSKSESVLEKETTKIREEDHVLRRRKQNIKGEDPATLSLDNDSTHNKQGYLSVIVLPFLLHLGFMSATAFFVMHVQVSLQLYLICVIVMVCFDSVLIVKPSSLLVCLFRDGTS